MEENESKKETLSETHLKIACKLGKKPLTDEEMLILACHGLASTYTRSEKECQ